MEELNRQSRLGGVVGNQRGFTLIEIIVVIVLLGLLSAVAVPKFVGLQEEARNASAQGVLGAAEGAASINFAAGLVGATQPAGGVINSGTRLMASLDGVPDGWTVDDTGVAGAVGICVGAGASCDVATATYSIIINTFEVAGTSKAVLAKGGTVAGW